MWLKLRSSVMSILQAGARTLGRLGARDRQPAAGPQDGGLDRAQIIESLGVDPKGTPALQHSWISIVNNADSSRPALPPERLEAMLRAEQEQRGQHPRMHRAS